MDNLNKIDFKALANKQKCIQMKMRLLALSHFQDGSSRTEIAKNLKVSRTSVNKWVRVFLNEGIDGLREKPRTGRPSFLTTLQKKQLTEYIEFRAKSHEGGRLTGSDIHKYIMEEFSQTYHTDYIYSLLKQLGFSWITSRSRHPKQSDKVQENFKKIPNANDP